VISQELHADYYLATVAATLKKLQREDEADARRARTRVIYPRFNNFHHVNYREKH
jgi:hypothetical protein